MEVPHSIVDSTPRETGRMEVPKGVANCGGYSLYSDIPAGPSSRPLCPKSASGAYTSQANSLKDNIMSTATTSNVASTARATPATRIATHPGSGRAVFACKMEVWDEVFAFADANGYQDETMSFILDAWLKTQQVH
jgi:hypothetical protein